MFSTLQRFLLRSIDKKPTGRWSLVYDSRLERRSELANEDHCGTCGQYAMQQHQKNIPKIRVLNKKDSKKL